MESIQKVLFETIQAIENMTLKFYQYKNEEGYQQLEPVLNKISQVIDKNNMIKQNSGIELLDISLMNMKLNLAVSSLQNSDLVLLADIMEYDIKPMLEQTLVHIQEG